MNKPLIIIAALAISVAAHAQSQDEAPVAPAVVASGVEAPVPEATPPAAPKEVLVREGKIRKLQHRCEKSNGVTGDRVQNVVQNTISQVSNKTGLGFALQFLAGGAAGNAVGSAAESSGKVCFTEVLVRLTDESEQSFETVVPALIGRSLRIWQKGEVRIEDGKPVFWFN